MEIALLMVLMVLLSTATARQLPERAAMVMEAEAEVRTAGAVLVSLKTL
jgi:hypothetical protein